MLESPCWSPRAGVPVRCSGLPNPSPYPRKSCTRKSTILATADVGDRGRLAQILPSEFGIARKNAVTWQLSGKEVFGREFAPGNRPHIKCGGSVAETRCCPLLERALPPLRSRWTLWLQLDGLEPASLCRLPAATIKWKHRGTEDTESKIDILPNIATALASLLWALCV